MKLKETKHVLDSIKG